MKTFVKSNSAKLPVQLQFLKESIEVDTKLMQPKKSSSVYVEYFATKDYYPRSFYKIKYMPILICGINLE